MTKVSGNEGEQKEGKKGIDLEGKKQHRRPAAAARRRDFVPFVDLLLLLLRLFLRLQLTQNRVPPETKTLASKTPSPVSRIEGRSDLYEMDLTLDVAVDVYPLAVGDKLSLALAQTLALDGGPTEPYYGAAAQGGRASLADAYEYVAHGTVFKLRDAAGGGGGGGGGTHAAVGRCEALVSFGGLLMRLAGDGGKLGGLRVGDGVYLLMRKVPTA